MRTAITLRLLAFPLLLGVFFAFRSTLLTTPYLVGFLTHTAIYLLSTFRERLLIFVLAVAALWAVQRLCVKFFRGGGARIGAVSAVVFGASAPLLIIMRAWHPVLKAGVLAVVMLINLTPVAVLLSAYGRPVWRKAITGFMGIGVGVTEIFLLTPFLVWIGLLWRQGTPPSPKVRRWLEWLPVLIVAAMFSVALPYAALAELDQRLFRDTKVVRFAGGDYRLYSRWDLTWMAMDATRERLFVCGNGTQSILAFDLRDLSRPPVRSAANTGGAEFCSYNPTNEEIYVYNSTTRELLWVDSNSLEVKRKVPVNFPEGETWISWEPQRDLLVVGSEATRPSRFGPGSPMYFFDRATGKVVGEDNLRVTWLLRHPSLPILYMDFSAGPGELIRYDLRNFRTSKMVKIDKSADRMEFDARRNEVLVTSPVFSRVLRYDADTLEQKPPIPTIFGVRAAVIDAQRDLLICASLLTNEIEVIDLNTHRTRRRYRVGPWLRDIVLDVPRGVAYISSRGALYRVSYVD